MPMMTQYPIRYPITTWKYPKPMLPTLPGTEINVTPDSDDPIMPKATRYHGDCRFAVKKVFVSAPFEVITEMRIRTAKYTRIMARTRPGVMRYEEFKQQAIRKTL